MSNLSIRLLTFNDYDQENSSEEFIPCKERSYVIQMFGLNHIGETYAVTVTGYYPFFYVKVGEDWTTSNKLSFTQYLYRLVGSKYFENTIIKTTLVKKNKLYGFNAGKQSKFVKIEFVNLQSFKKFKNLWYDYESKTPKIKTLDCCGYPTELYEAQIPPLLRMFHIKNIKPSGWILLPHKYCSILQGKHTGQTSCSFEVSIDYKRIITDPENETRVPYTIASFDIEASSSHGDFPVATKDYIKLAQEMVDAWDGQDSTHTADFIRDIILTSFGYAYEPVWNISRVYIKSTITEPDVRQSIKMFMQCKNSEEVYISKEISDTYNTEEECMMEGVSNHIIEEYTPLFRKKIQVVKSGQSVLSILDNTTFTRETRIQMLNVLLCASFPEVKGDEVTFIGTTFWRYGETEPYLNHCIVVGSCEDLQEVQHTCIETYTREEDAMLAWSKLIRTEDPDIVTGYNIFGFDYPFMYTRTKELGISSEFLKLSRNHNEICWKKDWKTNTYNIEENTIIIASGQHNLKFIKMNGRLNIDMYNYFRRDYTLMSYKLDYVSGYFIGDKVISYEHVGTNTKIVSKNLIGLEKGSYVILEEESYTVDKYKDGEKFKVVQIVPHESIFYIQGLVEPDRKKKIRWGLAKDDVTPQDIFRMTKEGPKERYIIAKYCIQDCNLVHHLMNKIDVITGYIEMSGLCSVPMDYLVMRGQGIKLTSYIAKKCREKGYLMPVLDKTLTNEGYEGAIVLPPKRNLYLDDPIACVDYGSLYPSSMISENISSDSKVWTKEYDLDGNIIKVFGEQDETGTFIYDNLKEYKYVDITYDTYQWRNKTKDETSARIKVKVGYKTCRFAQFPKGDLGILPAILKECLAARKHTRKQIIREKDEFMKNVLDKRQLSIKITANSIYGQTGAKTSTFYDQDVAASTTATGRKLLLYGQRVIEEAYKDRIVTTVSYGPVRTNAEYVYGDTDSIFFKFNLQEIDGTPIQGQPALKITIEIAKQAGELASKFLKQPHDLEYEKTFLPFCLLSKKRYVGMMYTDDDNHCKRTSMGIVLKRRDNAPIVKDIYGGIIDILMKNKNIDKAVEFLQSSLNHLMHGNIPMDKLVITKSLRGNYKNPNQIAHKVLADRIARRDPGNKPNIGDRIAFAYFKHENARALQGEKIETPHYIQTNKLVIDYAHYITNQIMIPVQQVFALVLEQMTIFKKKKGITLRQWNRQIAELKLKYPNQEVYEDQLDKLRNREVKTVLFDDYLRRIINKSNRVRPISEYFSVS